MRLTRPIPILLLALVSACSSIEPVAAPHGDRPADGDALAPTGWMALSLPEIARALREGEVSAAELTQAYLDRIDAIDTSGPTLQSVLSINPDALADARAADARRAAGEPLGPLHGVPILLKDNIESRDPLPTTAGSLALKDNVTGRDSPAVAGLRAAGAIILGKTNLSEWANFRSESSMSGWSALGGQVRNPHMLDRNPCGSSSGSAVAVSASLAAGAVGTETNGSIICPSTVNGIVGFKPTVGLVSQDYIVPISPTQDTAGPMTRTVRGAAMMLQAMARKEAGTDFVAALDEDALDGARIGVLRFAMGRNADVTAAFEDALRVMEARGATLVDIPDYDPGVGDLGARAYDLLKYEFTAAIDAYLATSAPAVGPRNLQSLIAFNRAHAQTELALFDQSIFEASVLLGDLSTEDYLAARRDVATATRDNGIDRFLQENDVAILVAPSGVPAPRIDPINGDVWPGRAGAGSLPARAGYPHATVPMGHVHGLPIGISFIGAADDDARVLAFAYAYEQATRHRSDPQFLPDASAREEIAVALRPARAPR
jgi:amidase